MLSCLDLKPIIIPRILYLYWQALSRLSGGARSVSGNIQTWVIVISVMRHVYSTALLKCKWVGVLTLTHVHITHISQKQRVALNWQIMENQNKQQPLRIPQLFPIPPLDQGLIGEAEKRGVTRSFTAWSGLISNKLASSSEDNFPAIFVTISDQTWSNHIQSGIKVWIKPGTECSCSCLRWGSTKRSSIPAPGDRVSAGDGSEAWQGHGAGQGGQDSGGEVPGHQGQDWGGDHRQWRACDRDNQRRGQPGKHLKLF